MRILIDLIYIKLTRRHYNESEFMINTVLFCIEKQFFLSRLFTRRINIENDWIEKYVFNFDIAHY